MRIKKHLMGGTLHAVQVTEIKRVLSKFSDKDQRIELASIELGIAPRTLRVWLGPVEKGGWEEFQGKGAVEKLFKTQPKKAKKHVKLKIKKKAALQTPQVALP